MSNREGILDVYFTKKNCLTGEKLKTDLAIAINQVLPLSDFFWRHILQILPNVSKKLSIGSSYAVNIFCGLGEHLGWAWTALKAHLICCSPLVVAFSNNLKSKKYYLSIFGSNKSGK